MGLEKAWESEGDGEDINSGVLLELLSSKWVNLTLYLCFWCLNSVKVRIISV